MERSQLKCVMLGDAGVGKTSIIQRFLRNEYQQFQQSTTGAVFNRRPITVDGKTAQLHLWDTAGQETFRAVASQYYRNAQIVLLVLDVTRPTTAEALRFWRQQLTDQASAAEIFIIANKTDSPTRKILTVEGQRLATDLRTGYFECSAATGDGITELFEAAVRAAMKKGERADLQKGINIDKKQKGCC